MPKLPQILAPPKEHNPGYHLRRSNGSAIKGMSSNTTTLPAELQGVTYVVRGEKSYELSNHLGNVLSVISDRREAGACTDSLVDFYYADGKSVSDYYPFGMGMDARTQSAGGYRWGFNGQEKDDEIAGTGNSYTAEFWQYDSRLGRRWNVDPVDKPWMSSYHAFSNKPITNIDPNGAEDGWVTDNESNQTFWDPNVNELGDLSKQGYDNNRYSYVGQEYKLNDGSGSLTVNWYSNSGELESLPSTRDPVGLILDLEFKPNNSSLTKPVGWLQTIASNWDGMNYSYYQAGKVDPIIKSLPEEYVDGNWSYDPTKSVLYTANTHFGDSPQRSPIAENTIVWQAQLSFLSVADNNLVRNITITYGFTINGFDGVKHNFVTITEQISNFHQTAIDNVEYE